MRSQLDIEQGRKNTVIFSCEDNQTDTDSQRTRIGVKKATPMRMIRPRIDSWSRPRTDSLGGLSLSNSKKNVDRFKRYVRACLCLLCLCVRDRECV
jgi:hypothetical protein